ncbi:MAG: hypothetical protein ABR912_07630 [Terracidiphilus sp.]|jgi:hypothetical protein
MAGLQQQKLEVASETHVRPIQKKPGRAGCTGRGAKILREAAGKAVNEKGKEIARSLLQGTLKGNVSSTKLLLLLADLKQEQGDAGKSRHGWSKAQALAAEPQWQEPAAEASAETTGGSREPEG